MRFSVKYVNKSLTSLLSLKKAKSDITFSFLFLFCTKCVAKQFHQQMSLHYSLHI